MTTKEKVIKILLIMVGLSICLSSYIIAKDHPISSEKNFRLLIEKDNFILAVLPDTQKYSRYKGEIFLAQTQWLAENYQQENIVFVAHLGDLVDLPDKESQWQVADQAIKKLDKSNLGYGVLAGNHDILAYAEKNIEIHIAQDNLRDNDKEPFLAYFPPERTANNQTYGGHSPNGWNSFYIFSANNQRFLALFLDWRPADSSLMWAESILHEYPDLPTILFTHQLMTIGSEKTAEFSGEHGLRLWDFVKKNNQIFMTINGHHHGAAQRIEKNNSGNDVILMVVDFQSDYHGGNGMMRTLEFDLNANRINVRSFSPWVLNKPEKDRVAQDILEKKDTNNCYTINLDFTSRFQSLSKLSY